jgi:predicted GIY-YIG superfamily endonuclease
MCKLNNIKNKEFIIYRIVNDNYVGVTTNLHKRLLKHRSRNGFDISNVDILETHTELDTALTSELIYQEIFKCKKGVRNQEGNKNPIAKEVLCLKTGIKFDTIKEACESLNYSYSHVRHLIKNNNNKFLLIKI